MQTDQQIEVPNYAYQTGSWGSYNPFNDDSADKEYVTLSDEKAFKKDSQQQIVLGGIKQQNNKNEILSQSPSVEKMSCIEEEELSQYRLTSDFSIKKASDKKKSHSDLGQLGETFYNPSQSGNKKRFIKKLQQESELKSSQCLPNGLKSYINPQRCENQTPTINSMFDRLNRPDSPTRKIIQRRKLTKLKDITNTIHNNTLQQSSVQNSNGSKLQFTFYNENKENQAPNSLPPQLVASKSYQPSPFNKLGKNTKILITSKSPSLHDHPSNIHPQPMIMNNQNTSQSVLDHSYFNNPSKITQALIFGNESRSISNPRNQNTLAAPQFISSENANQHHTFKRRQTLNDTFSKDQWKQNSLNSQQQNNILQQQNSMKIGGAVVGINNKINIVEKIRISYEIIQNKERREQSSPTPSGNAIIANIIKNEKNASSRNEKQLRSFEQQLNPISSINQSTVLNPNTARIKQFEKQKLFQLNFQKSKKNNEMNNKTFDMTSNAAQNQRKDENSQQNVINQNNITFIKFPQISKIGNSNNIRSSSFNY